MQMRCALGQMVTVTQSALKKINRETPQASSVASDPRQLRNPQASEGEGVAGKTQTLPYEFHAEQICEDALHLRRKCHHFLLLTVGS